MKPEFKTKLVEALRSGDYKRTTGRLRRGDRFCTLGVVCNLHAQAHPEFAAKQKDKECYDGQKYGLSKKVQDWAGLTGPQVDQMITWNDITKYTFAEQAGMIERKMF